MTRVLIAFHRWKPDFETHLLGIGIGRGFEGSKGVSKPETYGIPFFVLLSDSSYTYATGLFIGLHLHFSLQGKLVFGFRTVIETRSPRNTMVGAEPLMVGVESLMVGVEPLPQHV